MDIAAPKSRTESAIRISHPSVLAIILPIEALRGGEIVFEGAALGLRLGAAVGGSVKWVEGGAEGGSLELVGAAVGNPVSFPVGAGVGTTVSFPVGAGVGTTVSFPVGADVGCVIFEAIEGDMLGETDEFVECAWVGKAVPGGSVAEGGVRVGMFISA